MALITGGSSGIGLAIAKRLVAEGFRCIIADVREPEEAIEGCEFISCNAGDAEDVEQLSQHIHNKYEALDVLVSNAGQGIHERLSEGDLAKWEQVIRTNYIGALRVVRAFLPAMQQQGRGDVLFTGSVSARKPFEWGAIYGSTKAALAYVAEVLRFEVQPQIRVATITPGVVDTPFFERNISADHGVKDIGFGALTPDEIAEAAWYILSRPQGVAVNDVTIRPVAQPF